MTLAGWSADALEQLVHACEPYAVGARALRDAVADCILIQAVTAAGQRVLLLAVSMDGEGAEIVAAAGSLPGANLVALLPAVAGLLGVQQVRWVTRRLGLVKKAARLGARVEGFLMVYEHGR